MSAKLVELIETDELRGTGKDNDVFRRVKQWWTKEGDLVVEQDEWLNEERDKRRLELEVERVKSVQALDDQLGKEQGEVGLATRVLAAALGCKKWLEHEARHTEQELKSKAKEKSPGFCAKPFCWNPRQCYSPGNYSKLCRNHNQANAKRQRDAREKSKRRPKK